VFRLGVGAAKVKKKFWRWNSGEGWVLAAKVKKIFGNGISAKDGCWQQR